MKKGCARVYSVKVKVTNPSCGVSRMSGGINVAGSSTRTGTTKVTKQWTGSMMGMRTFGSATTTRRTSILSRATGQAIATPSSAHAKRMSSTVLVGGDNGGEASVPHVLPTTPSSPGPAPDSGVPPINQPIDRDPSNHFVFFDLEVRVNKNVPHHERLILRMPTSPPILCDSPPLLKTRILPILTRPSLAPHPQTTAAGIPYPSIRILELALCVTDKNFVPLDKGEQYLVHWKKKGAGRARGNGAWMETEDILVGMSKR